MFWGLTLEPGKHYCQTVEDSFHVSMAALEIDDNYNASKVYPPVKVMVEHDNNEFLLCTLLCRDLLQQVLDLSFTEGEQVKFYLEGKGVVHLTGCLVQEEPFDVDNEPILNSPSDSDEDGMQLTDDSDENETDENIPSLQNLATGEDVPSSESEEDWTPDHIGKKRKIQAKSSQRLKKIKKEEQGHETKGQGDEESEDEEHADDEDDDDDEEDILDEMTDLMEDIDAHAINGADQSASQKTSEQVSGDTSPSKKKKKRKKKKNPQGDGKQQDNSEVKSELISSGNEDSKSAVSKTTESLQTQTPANSAKKLKKKETKLKTPVQQQNTSPKKKLSNGVIIKDIVVGEGRIAKVNRKVGVYYKGTLAKSGKPFDSHTSGKPFPFRLGNKEVISGWDTGLAGMRVGGKRKLTIPASQAYGSDKMGSIPPNSTLLFEVEMKYVQ